MLRPDDSSGGGLAVLGCSVCYLKQRLWQLRRRNLKILEGL